MQIRQPKQNLLGLSQQGLENFFSEIGESSFHARQVMQWIHQRKTYNFDAMTDLSKSLREHLIKIATIELPTVISMDKSSDGTIKWLFESGNNQAVESVFIPEPDRGTLCISSQVGCALDCTFCATGAQGFNRNLGPEEIIGQVSAEAVNRQEEVEAYADLLDDEGERSGYNVGYGTRDMYNTTKLYRKTW